MTRGLPVPRRREGDWFAIPLAASGYAVGLVARAPRRGDTLFGYFFGPIRSDLPPAEELRAYARGDAICVARFEDDALVDGRWPILVSPDNWQRSAWPMPEFHMPLMQELAGESVAVRYSEDDPDLFVGQRPISREEEADYPPDEGVFPPEHLEHYLGELLGAPSVALGTEGRTMAVEEGVRHFLIVPSEAVGQLKRELAALGFDDVEIVEREDGMTDLSPFQGGSIDTLLAAADDMEAQLTALAHSVGGEYDGREWALPPPEGS